MQNTKHTKRNHIFIYKLRHTCPDHLTQMLSKLPLIFVLTLYKYIYVFHHKCLRIILKDLQFRYFMNEWFLQQLVEPFSCVHRRRKSDFINIHMLESLWIFFRQKTWTTSQPYLFSYVCLFNSVTGQTNQWIRTVDVRWILSKFLHGSINK